MKIIVVDDEFTALSDFLRHVVDNVEIEYRFFRGMQSEAVDFVRANTVETAFLDINMPGMNGVELAKELIRINPYIKIVFITGYAHDVDRIKREIGDNLYGFCYKPYDPQALDGVIQRIFSEEKRVRACTFPNFDLYVNKRLVYFSSNKAKELMAMLVVGRGKSLGMDMVITVLWPDRALEQAKKLYRDAVWRLRKTLAENGVEYIVSFHRAQLGLSVERMSCDYWETLEGKDAGYKGEFLSNYDWAQSYLGELDKAARRNTPKNQA